MLSFICVGPQRTASSWLDKMLRQHPEIALPQLVKETFFWDERYAKGHTWYYNHFSSRTKARVWGEVAPTCFDHPQALERIITDNPNIKVLICLRDPIERTYSLFCHYYATGQLKDSFSNALKCNKRLIEASKYSKYVELWGAKAGKENVLLVKQEGVSKDSIGVLNDICKFIGASPIQWEAAEEKYGQKVMPRSMFLTSILSRLGRRFRSLGLHSIPEFAKSIGLKKALYEGGKNKYPPLLEQDRLVLLDEFQEEYEWTKNLSDSRTFLLSDI